MGYYKGKTGQNSRKLSTGTFWLQMYQIHGKTNKPFLKIGKEESVFLNLYIKVKYKKSMY